MLPACPLCFSPAASLHHRARTRSYWRCAGPCGLIFVSPGDHPSADAEKARYDLHRNEADDPGYRAHLMRLLEPLLERVAPGSLGLDFGSGPGPVLAALLNERGRPTSCYDRYYAPDEAVWARSYDFITATEVLEHLQAPRAELHRLFAALRAGGWLGVLTQAPPEPPAFAGWHYLRDPTHVGFYSRRTLLYMAAEYGAVASLLDGGVTLFQKARHASATIPG